MTTKNSWTHRGLMGLRPKRETYYSHPVRGLRLRVYPTGEAWVRAWEYNRQYKGEKYRATLGSFPSVTMADAEYAANEANRALATGEKPFPETAIDQEAESGSIRVVEAWEHYLTAVRTEGSKFVDADRIRAEIMAVIGHKRLDQITTADIRAIRARPMDRPTGCTGGKARANGVLRMTRAFLNWCRREEGAGYDDFHRDLTLNLKYLDAREGRKPKRALTMREMALAIIAARRLDNQNDGNTDWADIMYLYCALGSRSAELQYMPKTEWNGADVIWHIPSGRYKTKAEVALPLGPRCAGIVNRLCSKGDGFYVIPKQSGIRTGDTKRMVDKITDLMRELGGEPVEKWRMHSIRYGFRTNIVEEGIATESIAERIIHPRKSEDMTTYYHVKTMESLRQSLTEWEARIDAEIASVTAEQIKVAA